MIASDKLEWIKAAVVGSYFQTLSHLSPVEMKTETPVLHSPPPFLAVSTVFLGDVRRTASNMAIFLGSSDELETSVA